MSPTAREYGAPAPRVIGIAGWSGAGKTTLIVKVIPVLVARGLRVAALKHAHHEFDVDTPGKDSWLHRQSGASEVIVASSRRWVQMHELGDAPEPPLAELLRRVSPCDLVLVEGYKRDAIPRLEVFRHGTGKAPLYPGDPHVIAVATDGPLAAPHPPSVDVNDAEAVARVLLDNAEALPGVLARLTGSSG